MFRTTLTLLVTAALAAAGGWFFASQRYHAAHLAAHASDGAAGNPAARKIRFYQSPMHPWITSDKPGKCTICGMTLVPVYEGEQGIPAGGNVVTLAASSAAVIGVQTHEVARGPLTRTLRLAGTIEADESRQKIIAAWTDARIERIHIPTTGVVVTAGQPLATVYSPDLLTARQEFHALATATPDSPLVSVAREKLRRLGLLDTQIDALAKADAVSRDTEILAPLSGTVIARAPAAFAGGYVNAGDELFTLADFSTLWALLDIYEPDLAVLDRGAGVPPAPKSEISNSEFQIPAPPPANHGQDARATADLSQTITATLTTPAAPGRTWNAPITYIDTNLNETTRTARARVELPNTDAALRRGQTVYATLAATLASDALLVPRSAVLFTRDQPVAWVAKGGTAYEPRSLRLGRAGDTAWEVLGGLAAGEHVVTEGALLVDGQAQISSSSAAADPVQGPEAGVQGSGNVAPGTVTPAGDNSRLQTPNTRLTDEVVHAAASASEALASDDLAAWKKIATTVPALAASAAAASDLKTARAAFEHWSTQLADQVLALPPAERTALGVRIYQCPMTPELGTGRWLQHATQSALRNPFFGSDMLECGEEVPGKAETLKSETLK
ncbi:RND family efflux transporter, MFP subunit [Opitutaceae bacterium TAV1]|nr:RND family efflux transporter, MFP subunit [Opitutaceae bacterium TAV1]